MKKRRTSHKYEDNLKAVVESHIEHGGNKNISGKRKGKFTNIHIGRCKEEGCDQRFYVHNIQKRWLPSHQYCFTHWLKRSGWKKPVQYRDISDEDERRLAREMKAKGCTVRKMTDEEKRQFGVN